MKRSLLFLFALAMTFGIANAQYSVLLVDDDANGSDESAVIDTALAHSGYSYSVLNIDTNAAPSYDDLKAYDMVIWTTANDGVSLNLWDVTDTAGNGPGSIKFNEGLMQYVDSGNVLWIDGLDFIYDIYGGAPDDFNAGDFVYDVMGLDNYVAQSKADDSVYVGLPMMLKASTNTIISLDTIQWQYSSLWYADAYDIVPGAVSLYNMGPADYDFAGKSSFLYFQNVITSTVRLGKIGDGSSFQQDNLDIIIGGMVAAAENGTFVKTSGLQDVTTNLNVNVYPNPTKGNITFTLPVAQNVSLKVFDITGKVIINKTIASSNGSYILNLNGVQSGMYFYQVTVNNASKTGKFSVVK